VVTLRANWSRHLTTLVPKEFLKHYRGHLQADAYVAYDAFFTQPEPGMVEVGCWAHARWHFHNAPESDPSRMRTVLLLIAQLYNLERTARQRDLDGEELPLLREHASRPVLDRLQAYLLKIRDGLLLKSEAGQAVAYTLKN
jgi:transposase